MPETTLSDILEVVRRIEHLSNKLQECADDLNALVNHAQAYDFCIETKPQMFLQILSELKHVPKLNLSKRVDARAFRAQVHLTYTKFTQIKLGRSTKQEMDEVRELLAQLLFVVDSAYYPLYDLARPLDEFEQSLEDPADP